LFDDVGYKHEFPHSHASSVGSEIAKIAGLTGFAPKGYFESA
jgi:hypothetical protein